MSEAKMTSLPFSRALSAALLVVLSLLAFMGLDAYRRGGGGGSASSSSSSSSSSSVLSLAARGKSSKTTTTKTLSKKKIADYGLQRVGYSQYSYFGDDASDVLTYKILKDSNAIIEPYADMGMRYYGNDIDEDDLSYYSYKVFDKESGEELSAGKFHPNDSGLDDNVNVACSPLSDLEVVVHKYQEDNSFELSFTLNAKCIYVRRELRSLTSDDLDKTMDAMYAMWSTADAEGQTVYGADFHSATFFAEMHDFNAAWMDGDHIHEGLGFLPQHIKMSNMFEASMQAVDPSVTLFYWDFTVDEAAGSSIFESLMFSEDTFGSLTESSSTGDGQWFWSTDNMTDGYIPNGRWSSVKAQRNPFEDLPSAYGYMRGPWCMNPAPKITRYAGSKSPFKLNLPSCLSYVSWLEDDDKMSFLKTAEDAPHAVVHGNIGGVYGCDVLEEMQTAGYLEDSIDDLASVCMKWTFYMKEMYRANLVSPQTDCVVKDDVSVDSLQCGFVCNDDEADDWIDTFSAFSIRNNVPSNIDNNGWEAWRQFACTGNGFKIFTGDHLESASPNDPSFWPIHPTQERLYQAKMMAGGFKEDEWPTETGSGHKYSWVCNHAKCFDYKDPDSDEKDYYDSCCQGHFEDDQLLDHANEDRSLGYGITNRQAFLDTDPTSKDYAMTYVYDDFSWSHCDSKDDAKDVKAKVLSLAEEKRKRRSLRQKA